MKGVAADGPAFAVSLLLTLDSSSSYQAIYCIACQLGVAGTQTARLSTSLGKIYFTGEYRETVDVVCDTDSDTTPHRYISC